MTYYDSRADYEVYGRADNPGRRSYSSLVGWDWDWDSDVSRARYRQLRNSAKEADRRATFSVGAMLLNRVIAAIDAFRSAKAFNRGKALGVAQTHVRINGNPFGAERRFMLVLQRTF